MDRPGTHANGDTDAIRFLEKDDRGVFGPQGIKGLSASARRKYNTALQPARSRAWIFIKQRRFDEAEELLRQSLPRDAGDAEDERYFGIYCGLSDVAIAKGDRLAALDWFRQGIERFPTAIRQNHVVQLSALGVDVSRWIRNERDDGFAETDAMAILQSVHAAMQDREKTIQAVRAEGKVLEEIARLEKNGGKESRSAVRSYLG